MTGARADFVDHIRDRRIEDFFAANRPDVRLLTPEQLTDLIKILLPKVQDFIKVDDQTLLKLYEDLYERNRHIEESLESLRKDFKIQKNEYESAITRLKSVRKKKESKKKRELTSKSSRVVNAPHKSRERKTILGPVR